MRFPLSEARAHTLLDTRPRDGCISLEDLLVYVLYLTVCDLCHLQGNCSNHIVLICNAGSSSRSFMVFPDYVNFCNELQNSWL